MVLGAEVLGVGWDMLIGHQILFTFESDHKETPSHSSPLSILDLMHTQRGKSCVNVT